MSSLKEAVLNKIQESEAEAVGLAFISPVEGLELFINADRSFHPASTFKLAVMMEAFRRDAEGTFRLDEPVLVMNQFTSIADGSPYSLHPEDDSDSELYGLLGAELAARELVERMIVKSGNLATNVLLQFLGAIEVTAFMRRLGTEDLVVRRGVEDNKAYKVGLNNEATARGLAIALSRLAAHEGVSPEADKEMLDILLRQHYREGIPRLLPQGTKVAHKTGWNGLLYHDAAIVYPEGRPPYILVVMTQGLSDEKEGPDLTAKISRLVYDSVVLA